MEFSGVVFFSCKEMNCKYVSTKTFMHQTTVDVFAESPKGRHGYRLSGIRHGTVVTVIAICLSRNKIGGSSTVQ
jgi:hypothetical protein